MIRHILFDLDETLYPTSCGLMREISRRMTDYMVNHLGIPDGEVNALRQFYWEHYGTTLRGLYLERHIDAQAFLDFVHDIRVGEYLQGDAALDAMLTRLEQQKHIFTNAPKTHAERVLGALGVARHFTHIFDINFIAYESKPMPSAYQKILDALSAPAEECLLVEDSVRNLLPAKRLGMRTVLLDGRGAGESLDGVDVVIKTIYEVPEIVAVGAGVHRL